MRGPFGANPRDLQKMIEQTMQQMQKTQQELKNLRIESSVGGGVVKAVVDGTGELIAIEINPVVVDPNDVEMLQDLIVSAVNEAREQAVAEATRRMGALTGMPDLDLGNLF
ncbi:MAG: YbaB/EbfC family nucleoid-associated protein [Armatimonadota bacterium]|nr:YbaB/EbfC family nucleoid-associated protein [bacterium]MDW8320213.1 YbaB/EbfC family nucleoid-associated protein [Armatimonadota bacterium]